MVLSKIGHELSRRVIGSSLAGDGLLVRIRSTSIGLLGLVAATGLALVAFISSQGWPDALNSPIPASPSTVSAVHDAVALHPPRSTASPAPTPARRHGVASPRQWQGVNGGISGSAGRSGRLRGAHRVSAPSPVPQAPSTPAAPSPQPAPVPVAQPSVPAAGESGPSAERAPESKPAPAAAAPVASSGEKARGPSHESARSTNVENGNPEARSHAGTSVRSKPKAAAKPAPVHHVAAPPHAESTPAAASPAGEAGSPGESNGNGHAYGKSGKGGN